MQKFSKSTFRIAPYTQPMRILTLTVLGSIAILVGCNSQVGNSKLSKESATAMKQTIQVSLEQSGKVLSQRAEYGSSIKTSGGNGLQPAGNCSLNLTLSEDKDKDLVPLNASATADCNWTGTNGDFARLTGSFAATDKDDNDATSGFKLTGDNIGYAYKFGIFNDAFNFSGVFDLTKNSPGNYGVSVTANATRNADSASHTMNLAGVSDDATKPFSAATLNGSGSTSLNRSGTLISLSSSVSNLHYTKTCTSTGFDRGTVAWTDGTNTLTAEYKSCGVLEIKYNAEVL